MTVYVILQAAPITHIYVDSNHFHIIKSNGNLLFLFYVTSEGIATERPVSEDTLTSVVPHELWILLLCF